MSALINKKDQNSGLFLKLNFTFVDVFKQKWQLYILTIINEN